jgi:hypothetical protein
MGEGEMLHLDGDIPSIYLPVGRPEHGGTCAFATINCLDYCPSGQIVNVHEKNALRLLKLKSPIELIASILLDYEMLTKQGSANMIQWFTWGDCLPDLTEKVANVIINLNESGVVQYGSTRNKKLWELLPTKCHFAFTMDNVDKAKELSKLSGKRTCSPDTNTGYAQFIFAGRIIAKCSGWWHITPKETRNSDCTKCLLQNDGCFYC